MREQLFLRIVEGITTYSIELILDFFVCLQQRPDARGVSGFSTILKVTPPHVNYHTTQHRMHLMNICKCRKQHHVKLYKFLQGASLIYMQMYT